MKIYKAVDAMAKFMNFGDPRLYTFSTPPNAVIRILQKDTCHAGFILSQLVNG